MADSIFLTQLSVSCFLIASPRVGTYWLKLSRHFHPYRRMNMTTFLFLTLHSTCAQETNSSSFARLPVFFLNVLNLFLPPTSPLRKLIFSIAWHDQFPSSFSKNKTYSCSVRESFCQKTTSTPTWWTKPFPLQVALGHGVYLSNRKQRRAVIDVVPTFPVWISIVWHFLCKRSCLHRNSQTPLEHRQELPFPPNWIRIYLFVNMVVLSIFNYIILLNCM